MTSKSSEVQPDTLSGMFGEMRFSSAVFAKVALAPPWGMDIRLPDRVVFHFVAEGQCLLEVEGVEGTSSLVAGDLVILPHGHCHVLRDAPESAVQRFDDLLRRHWVGNGCVLRHGEDPGSATSLICGGFEFDEALAHPVLCALPRVMALNASKPGFEWLRFSQELITRELSSGRPGASLLAARLADAIFIEATRNYFAELHGDTDNWVTTLREPAIRRAIVLMRREARKRWTVSELAKHVGLSRSVFAARFRDVTGHPPLQYLARHRIETAGRLLLASNEGVAAIAAQVGYESEAAFCRAFSRLNGATPAAFRKKCASLLPAQDYPSTPWNSALQENH